MKLSLTLHWQFYCFFFFLHKSSVRSVIFEYFWDRSFWFIRSDYKVTSNMCCVPGWGLGSSMNIKLQTSSFLLKCVQFANLPRKIIFKVQFTYLAVSKVQKLQRKTEWKFKKDSSNAPFFWNFWTSDAI